MRRTRTPINAPAVGRAGVTLTEVLIALLILSIGVLSVFSLYPISLLRSIKASQSTNGKIAAGNALARLRGNDRLLNGVPLWRPGATYVTGDVIAVPPADGGALSPSTTRWVATVNGAAIGTSGLDVPPFERYEELVLAGGAAVADPPGVAGGTEQANAANPPPGGIFWQPASEPVADFANSGDGAPFVPGANYGGIADGASLLGGVYVVDPRGWMTIHEVSGGTANGRVFRDLYGTAPRLDAGMRTLLAAAGTAWGGRSLAQWGLPAATINSAYSRLYDNGTYGFPAAFPAGLPSATQVKNAATRLTSRIDSYTTLAEPWEPLPTEYTAAGGVFTEFALPAGILPADMAQVATDQEGAELRDGVRLIVRSLATGRSAEVPLSSANFTATPRNAVVGAPLVRAVDLGGSTIGGTVDDVLPVEVRIVNRWEQYSWLYTMRRSGGTASEELEGDVVVFFRRGVDQNSEAGFAASFGNNPFDTTDDLVTGGAGWTANGTYDPSVAGTNRNRAWVAGTRDVDGDGVAEADADVTVGRWVFDSVGGHWYQIDAVLATTADASSSVPGAVIYALQLDRPVERVTSPQVPGAVTGTTLAPPTSAVGLNYPQAVIPKGVVGVFPISLGRDGDGV